MDLETDFEKAKLLERMRITSDQDEFVIDDSWVSRELELADNHLRDQVSMTWGGSGLGRYFLDQDLHILNPTILYTEESLEGKIDIFYADRIAEEDVEGYGILSDIYIIEDNPYEETVPATVEGTELENINLRVPTSSEYEKEINQRLEEAIAETDNQSETDRETVDELRHMDESLKDFLEEDISNARDYEGVQQENESVSEDEDRYRERS